VLKAEDIRRWRGHDVVDTDHKKIGKLEAIYVDTRTDEPSFATIRVGLPTRYRLAFVPLASATVGPGYLRVDHPRSRVRRAPSIDPDGELRAADEEAVFSHYDLPYQAASGRRWLARR
jgi:PRC-barrel domain protein